MVKLANVILTYWLTYTELYFILNWQSLVDNRQRFFWLLQIAGWIGYALVNYIGSKVFEMRDIYVFVILLNAYAGCLMTVPLRYIYRKTWNASPWILMVVVFGASYITGTLWLSLIHI